MSDATSFAASVRSRRWFLRVALSQVATAPLLVQGCSREPSSACALDPVPCAPDELDSFERVAVVRAYFGQDYLVGAALIGAEVLARARDEGRPAASRVADALAIIEQEPDDTRAVGALDLAVQADFVALRASELKGWVLSDTEQQLCALWAWLDASDA